MRYFTILTLGVAAKLLISAPVDAPTPEGRGFPSADAAAKALVNAAKSDNVTVLTEILGPSSKEILTTSDPVADRQTRQKFAKRGSAKTKLIPDPREPN